MSTPPSAAARVKPTIPRLGDGYQTLVSFKSVPNIPFFEKTITPPGVEGSEPNEATSMFSTRWRTFHPRRLLTLTPFSLTAHYSPTLYTSILALINVQDTVTVFFPDGSNLAFYGFLKNFKPGSLEDGKTPECNLEVVPTNMDPTDCTEQGPTFTAGLGTHCY